MLLRCPVPPGPTTSTGFVLQPAASKFENGLHVCGPADEPMPSWPRSLRPQVHTVPSERSATLWLSPEATATTPLSRPVPPGPTTPTGTVLHTSEEDGGRPLTGQCSGPALVPSPSSPQMLAPHDQTCPPEPMLLRSIARLCTLPAEIAVMLPSWPVPPGPTTTTGRVS